MDSDYGVEVAEVLEAAADSILVHGWGQEIEWIENDEGVEVPYCALGHIGYAMEQKYGREYSPRAAPITALQHHLFLKGKGEWSIIGWNDHPGTTAAEVRDAFLLTAKDIRNKAVAE